MAKRKFYAVKIGRHPGVYETWDECREQISGFKGAVYKCFKTKRDAEDFVSGKLDEITIPKKGVAVKDADVTIYVDGSFDARTRVYGYGFVAIFKDGAVKEFCGANNDMEAASIRNVAGEILGAMFAVKYAKNSKCKSVKICYDYTGIEMWARGCWKAKNEYTRVYADYMKRHGKEIKILFEKVDAHTGVEYNERADQLAKHAVDTFNKGRWN